jgi:hypothetical protein
VSSFSEKMVKHCKERVCCKGKSCGKTCIKKSYNCRKDLVYKRDDDEELWVFPDVPSFKPCEGGLKESNAIDEFNRVVFARFVDLM